MIWFAQHTQYTHLHYYMVCVFRCFHRRSLFLLCYFHCCCCCFDFDIGNMRSACATYSTFRYNEANGWIQNKEKKQRKMRDKKVSHKITDDDDTAVSSESYYIALVLSRHDRFPYTLACNSFGCSIALINFTPKQNWARTTLTRRREDTSTTKTTNMGKEAAAGINHMVVPPPTPLSLPSPAVHTRNAHTHTLPAQCTQRVCIPEDDDLHIISIRFYGIVSIWCFVVINICLIF